MSLTAREATVRAAHIWGASRLITVKLTPWNGGADITLFPAGIATDVRERNYCAHQLDADGHAVCHPDCSELETQL